MISVIFSFRQTTERLVTGIEGFARRIYGFEVKTGRKRSSVKDKIDRVDSPPSGATQGEVGHADCDCVTESGGFHVKFGISADYHHHHNQLRNF
ncbi:hypothetical protein JCGZ_12460 [Jatropha curcas]|uniref:Uncharacterized protein n=1 Tax=Jatropha curcas TaxID=180498 RepID=A0A067KJI6_JATCU|nr:hypothetical protein JCGZ_12460 [Jatropha curcas]